MEINEKLLKVDDKLYDALDKSTDFSLNIDRFAETILEFVKVEYGSHNFKEFKKIITKS